jgi:hypothetical protein
MKIVYLCLSMMFAIFWVPVLAQDAAEPPVTLNKTASGYTYEKIVDLPSVTKQQAYDRVKKWIVANLKTTDNNISFDDVDRNNIGTSAALILQSKHNILTARFKISFSFKDNKLKINASQFTMSSQVATVPFSEVLYIGKKHTRETYEKFDEDFSAMINAIVEAAKKDDNW